MTDPATPQDPPVVRISLTDLYEHLAAEAADGAPFDVEAGLERLNRWIDEQQNPDPGSFQSLLEASFPGHPGGGGAPASTHAWLDRVMAADPPPATAEDWAALADPGPIPDDPTEALRLAADAITKAANTVRYDHSTLPDEWHTRYAAVIEIITGLANLAHHSIDAVPMSLVGQKLDLEALGGSDLHRVLGEWIVRTNATAFTLGEATGHWAVAHQQLAKLKVHVCDQDGEA